MKRAADAAPGVSGLGNDIVDLSHPQNRASARRSAYVERVLSPREREAQRIAPDPERCLWAFWAAKEAWHKARSGFGSRVPFHPRSLCVLQRFGVPETVAFECDTPVVCTADDGVSCRWAFKGDAIHCVVVPPDLEWCADVCTLGPSEAIDVPASVARASMHTLVDRLADTLGLAHPHRGYRSPRSRLERPRLRTDGATPQSTSLSLSHDGRFIAAAVGRVCERSASGHHTGEPDK
ncbi:MAG: 4'-phosphopantetheinyl transferase superfamily protein [Pseudomonadota bacterium]